MPIQTKASLESGTEGQLQSAIEEIIKIAKIKIKKGETTELINGKCSKCGKIPETSSPNFCKKCQRTFITQERIEKWRNKFPSILKTV